MSTLSFTDSSTISLTNQHYLGTGTIDADDEVGGVIMDLNNGCSYPGSLAQFGDDAEPDLWDWILDYDFNPNDLGYNPPMAADNLVEYVWDIETTGDNSRIVTYPAGSPGGLVAQAVQKSKRQDSALKVTPPKLSMDLIPDPNDPEAPPIITVRVHLPKKFTAFACLTALPSAHGKHVTVMPLVPTDTGVRETTFTNNVGIYNWVHVAVVVKKHRARPVSQRLKPYEGMVHGGNP